VGVLIVVVVVVVTVTWSVWRTRTHLRRLQEEAERHRPPGGWDAPA